MKKHQNMYWNKICIMNRTCVGVSVECLWYPHIIMLLFTISIALIGIAVTEEKIMSEVKKRYRKKLWKKDEWDPYF